MPEVTASDGAGRGASFSNGPQGLMKFLPPEVTGQMIFMKWRMP
jgi:hypothetical protein